MHYGDEISSKNVGRTQIPNGMLGGDWAAAIYNSTFLYDMINQYYDKSIRGILYSLISWLPRNLYPWEKEGPTFRPGCVHMYDIGVLLRSKYYNCYLDPTLSLPTRILQVVVCRFFLLFFCQMVTWWLYMCRFSLKEDFKYDLRIDLEHDFGLNMAYNMSFPLIRKQFLYRGSVPRKLWTLEINIRWI